MPHQHQTYHAWCHGHPPMCVVTPIIMLEPSSTLPWHHSLPCRGSLHVHCLLWVAEEDLERVSNEITAAMPGQVDANGDHIRPEAGPDRLLYDIITRKNLHRCKVGQCKKHEGDTCRLGFPADIKTTKEIEFNVSSNRWMYYRPTQASRNVVPYHPALSVLWNAHANILRVTDSAWSTYLLVSGTLRAHHGCTHPSRPLPSAHVGIHYTCVVAL
jgi:hypothetical protein